MIQFIGLLKCYKTRYSKAVLTDFFLARNRNMIEKNFCFAIISKTYDILCFITFGPVYNLSLLRHCKDCPLEI